MEQNQLIGNIQNELHIIEEYVTSYYNKQLPSGRSYILNIETFKEKIKSLRTRCLELNEVDSTICPKNICTELRDIINEDIPHIYYETKDPDEISERINGIFYGVKNLLAFAK